MKYLSLTGLQYFYNKLKTKVLLLTGNQTVGGVKTFSSSPVVPDAVNNGEAVNKGQLDTVDNSAVHKTGNETIDGVKTFSNNSTDAVVIKDSDRTAGVNPSALKLKDIVVTGSNNAALGFIRQYTTTDGSNAFQIVANSFGTNNNAALTILAWKDKTANDEYVCPVYISAPLPWYGGNEVVTAGWVNNACVHKTGNETVTGTKTFSSTINGSVNGSASSLTATYPPADNSQPITTQPINTVRNYEGNHSSNTNTPEAGTYSAGTSVLFGSLQWDGTNANWTRGFWLYGKWNTAGLWYGQRPDTSSANITWKKIAFEDACVLLTGNQTVAGTKTFSSVPLCGTTPSAGDSSSKLANTAFVQQEIQGLGSKFSASVNSNGHLIITIGD